MELVILVVAVVGCLAGVAACLRVPGRRAALLVRVVASRDESGMSTIVVEMLLMALAVAVLGVAQGLIDGWLPTLFNNLTGFS